MSEVQIAIIDQEDTQITLAVPGVQGPVGNAIPSGGTTNQVLFKSSATNYDATWGNVTSAMITDLAIVNADVNASAAIAGSKISPDFGAQTIVTTGVHSAALGAAATPSITFTGDLNTGIYSPSADQLAVATNGTGRLFVDGNGQVSVVSAATTTTNLTVNGATSFSASPNWNFPGLLLRRTASNIATAKQISFLLDGDTESDTTLTNYLNIWGTYSGPPTTSSTSTGLSASMNLGAPNAFIAHTNGSERLRITSTGLVGTGTSSPQQALHVSQSGGNNFAGIRSQNSNTGTGTAGIEFSSDVTYAKAAISLVRGDANGVGSLVFYNASSTGAANWSTSDERLRIDSSGRLLVGTSTARANLFNATISPGLQLEAAGALGTSNRFISVVNNFASNGDGGGVLALGRSKGGTIGSNTLVASGDQLGRFDFQGNDGTEFVTGATIEGYVDGTPGANDMPGRLVFSTTADGASSPTEAMRIKSTGIINFSNAPTHADNTAATAAGLAVGDVYKTVLGVLMIRF